MTASNVPYFVSDGDRPFTDRTFHVRVRQFDHFIESLIHYNDQFNMDESKQLMSESFQFDHFCLKIKELFGCDLKKQDLRSIYKKILTNPGAKVDWSEIFGFNSASISDGNTVGAEVPIFHVSARRTFGLAAGNKRRRDVIQMVKYIPSIDSYITCSLKGVLALWSAQLRLQSCVDIHESTWSTSCEYLSGLKRVLCTTERSIVLWDSRAQANAQGLFIIQPIEDAPQSVAAIPTPDESHGDTVVYGDDQGFINLLTILPQDLAYKHSKQDRRSELTESHSIDPKHLTREILRKKVHDEAIIKVKYFPSLKCFGSCSLSSISSFALENVDRIFFQKKEVRCVAIRKGVNCFDLCVRSNILATAGVDKIIRLWHPHIFSRPSGKLIGHLFTISDMAVNETDQHLISLSTARIFRIWDIHTLTCLQVFTDNEARSGDRRIYSISYDNKNERLLSGSSTLDSWPLSRTIKDSPPVPISHDRPIVQILLNKEVNLLASVCTQSIIKVWELDSGHLTYSLCDPHGAKVEVTCMALDKTCSKLVTGAKDGSLKIWDFTSGQMIKSRMTMTTYGLSELSVTAIVCTRKYNENYIVTSTPSKLLIYVDSPASTRIVLIQEIRNLLQLPKDVQDNTRTLSSISYRSSRTEQLIDQTMLSKASSELTAADDVTDKQQTIRNMADVTQTYFPVTRMPIKSETVPKITCMTPVMSETIAAGYSNGSIIIWDVEKMVMKSQCALPKIEKDSEYEDQVNQIAIMVYKRHFLRKSTAHQTASHLSATLERSRQRRAGQVVLPNLVQLESDKTRKDTLPKLSEVLAENSNNTIPPSIKDEQMKETKNMEENIRVAKRKSTIDRGGKSRETTKVSSSSSSVLHGQSVHDPILVSIHHSSCIKFWNIQGELLHGIEPVIPKLKIPTTAVCFNPYTHSLFTGNSKGYVTAWDVQSLLQDPYKQEDNCVQQKLCWRAHTNKVIMLEVIEISNVVLSASTDGSIRMWQGNVGAYVGYFGQKKQLHVSNLEELMKFSILPFDISEGPLAPIEKAKSSPKIKFRQHFECPLIFSQSRWEPFHRSANESSDNTSPSEGNKKFFGALMKPKAYKSHLESYTTADSHSGAVFRSLPVYTIGDTNFVKNVDATLKHFKDNIAVLGVNQFVTKTSRRKTKDDANHLLPKLSS